MDFFTGKKPVRAAVADDAWLQGQFITTVQNRGAAVIAARKLSSAASAAQAIVDHMRDWTQGTPEACSPLTGLVPNLLILCAG